MIVFPLWYFYPWGFAGCLVTFVVGGLGSGSYLTVLLSRHLKSDKTCEFYQIFKENLTTIFSKLFQKYQKRRDHLNGSIMQDLLRDLQKIQEKRIVSCCPF